MAGNSRNTAISPHPKLIWPGTRHTVWKTGASIVASWHLEGEPLSWLAIPATKQWAPIPVPSCPGPVRMPGMSGSRFCDNQPLEREPLPWLVIPAGNQAIGPTQHRVGGTRHTVFTVEIKGMGKKGRKEVITHPTEKSRHASTRWNVLWGYDHAKCSEHALKSAVADRHEHIGCSLLLTS